MKTKLFTLLLGCSALILTAAEPLSVSCTTFPLWIFAKNLTKGIPDVQAELIIPASTGCPHDYVLTPQDMRKLGRKNMILVCNGAGLDDFLLRSLKRINPDVPVINVTEGMNLLKTDAAHEHHHHHHGKKAPHEKGEHHEEESVNPHAFASPFAAVNIVRKMTDGLCKYDPAHAQAYRKNGEVYREKLEQLCRKFTEAAAGFRSRNIITMHPVFDYLAAALNLSIVMELNDGESGLSAAKIREAVKVVREKQVRVILSEPQYSDKGAQTLARECGIRCESLDPVASGPESASEDYYEKVMQKNILVLKEHLSR